MIEPRTYIINMKLPSLNQYIYINAELTSMDRPDIKKRFKIILQFFLTGCRFMKTLFIKKFILDTMVQLGKIQNDSWGYILGFSDRFCLSKEKVSKVILTIFEKRKEETNEYYRFKNNHRKAIIAPGDKKFN